MRSFEIRYFALRVAAVVASALVIGAGVSFVLTKGNHDAGGGEEAREAPDSAQVLEQSATPQAEDKPAARAPKAARDRDKPVKRVAHVRRTAAAVALATPRGASPRRSPAARTERRGASATPAPAAPRRTARTPGGRRDPVATPRQPRPAPSSTPNAAPAPTAQPAPAPVATAPPAPEPAATPEPTRGNGNGHGHGKPPPKDP